MSRPFNRRGLLGAFALAPLTAAPALATAHPDAEILRLERQWRQAGEVLADSLRELNAARDIVHPVLSEWPASLARTPWEQRQDDCLNNVFVRMRVRFRWTPPRDESGFSAAVWTGAGLRRAIAGAVPHLGRGGLTPHRIRRWKALLPQADAFDSRVEAAEARAGLKAAEARKREAERVRGEATGALSACVATTPEGLAALVRVVGGYRWKDEGGAWPNLLRSAAIVSGVGLDALEHQHASLRGPEVAAAPAPQRKSGARS
ncbi:hypothetical protein [Methylobacterium sp. CCH5-D2]|uniref:hypothetical protein n=1 Tax=Methylobacterium sp. CCH5-D2 TaxID=1768765 RepID=UPI000830D643|nr:hypothetical protein [Methylobacterium sp. CCH5-D2]